MDNKDDWAVEEADRLFRIVASMSEGNARVIIAERLRVLRKEGIAEGIVRVSESITTLASQHTGT